MKVEAIIEYLAWIEEEQGKLSRRIAVLSDRPGLIEREIALAQITALRTRSDTLVECAQRIAAILERETAADIEQIFSR